MRFPIYDRTLKEAYRRYDISRKIRYGEDNGVDPFNPGHKSRILGCAIENQISIWLFGKPSGFTDIKADTDGGFDLVIHGKKWDVKANNVENAGSWLINYPKGDDNRDPRIQFLCVNGHLTDVNDPFNRTFEIAGAISMEEVWRVADVKQYRFGKYYRVTTEMLRPFDEFDLRP